MKKLFMSDYTKLSGDKSSRKIDRLSAKDLAELMSIAEELRKAMQADDKQKLQSLEQSKGLMLNLLEYLIQNMDNPSVDPELIMLLRRFLGLEKTFDQKLLEQEEEKEFSEASKEQKAHLYRAMVYEIYKVLNPNRIAGETAIENFINNVKAHGMKEAMKHEGKEFAQKFRAEDLEKIESHRHSFVDALSKGGHSKGGWSRG